MADEKLLVHLDNCRRYPSLWSKVESAALAWRAQQRIEEVESERDKLRQALDALGATVSNCGGADMTDYEDVLVPLGLLVEVPADERHRELYDEDTMLVLAWTVKGATEP